jgi:multidrug transporter EmrE-like cation transporter
MVALFMVPATVLSVLSTPEPDGVRFLLALGAIAVAMRSNLPDSSMRHLVAESSVVEKFVTETAIKIAYAGIPFAVHAVLAKQFFTDGFEVDYLILLWIIIWSVTILRTPKYGSINTESARHKIQIFLICLYSITYISLILGRYSNRTLDTSMPYPLWVKILLLVVGMVLFGLSYYLYNKRFADYEKL